ncbi:MAG: DUF5312 family protein [Treponema sp.]|jgi:hypothetical protein|nr:DUF5312 family protein [Treponema sp.]
MEQKTTSGGNFFINLFAALFGNKNPEAEKKRQLRIISKDLSKTHTRYYKINSDEALPALAKFFYELYKAAAPAQALFQNAENENIFKNFVINYSLNEKQHQLTEDFSEGSIRAKAKTVPLNELSSKMKQDLDLFLGEFDADSINKINNLYSNLLAFKKFCTFDYYFLLKKFDSSLRERVFNTTPRFEKINAEYIAEDLQDFVEIIYGIPEHEDWSTLMKLFRDAKGTEPITANVWNKILAKLENLKRTQVFEMMIQLITKNPGWNFTVSNPVENIIDPYLQKITSITEKTLKNLAAEEKNSKAGKLLMQIFGTNVVLRLANYTEQNSVTLETKGIGSYTFSQPLNYMKAFLIEFVKKDIREYADLVLIRGEWATNALSIPMSDAYNALLEISNQITAFDERLAEDGEIGSKIKTMMPRAGRDREARNIINTLTNDANDAARDFLIRGTKNLVTIAKTVKSLIEDYSKKSPELVINWKELDHFAEHPIKELGIEVYKKIYLFTALMQTFLTKKTT